MKLLPDIRKEDYNDVQKILNYLFMVREWGDEDVEPIRYFHCFWKGDLSDLHLMSLKSLHETHPKAKVILWTLDPFETQGTHSWIKIKKLLKDKIEVIQVTGDHFKQAGASILYSQFLNLTLNKPNYARYNHDVAYASDIIRFIVLYIYGGVWFDMDILFLRNFNSIKINRYVSQWGDGPVSTAGNDLCGNAAIMRLEQGHSLITDILLGKYPKPFYPTTTFQLDNNLDITILPSSFFDILWTSENKLPEDLQFKTFDEFFSIEKFDMPTQLYAYHWHNRWNKKPPPFFK